MIEIYRALDIFSQEEKNLQSWIFEHSKKLYDRDLSRSYFDCTNYYFKIENNDNDLIDEESNILKKKTIAKEVLKKIIVSIQFLK
ncbi:MAG: hypothetical protein RSC27_04600 [Bacilli bacterium]